MKKVLILIALILTFGVTCSASMISCALDNQQYNNLPEPRLKSPIYDTVTLNVGQPLEFSWWNDCVNTGSFILKIYKGYNMYADNLILKETLSADLSSYEARADLFDDGKVYTWSLVRVSFAGYKSDRSFNSFKVIKRGG
ncbi:MAG: hypothetical protein NT014_04755 [Candidatus Omnitrophica bacterium]|nr:hypothetical protein [Candidatus Omnitrophota bacterium]